MAIRFGVRGDSIQLDQLLKATGLADSGGAAKAEVAEGKVKVDGQVELRKRATLRPGQVIEYGGETIELTPGTAADVAPLRTPRPKKAPAPPPKGPAKSASGTASKGAAQPFAKGPAGGFAKAPSKGSGAPSGKPEARRQEPRSPHAKSVVGHGRAADTHGGAKAARGGTRPTSKTGSRSGGQKRLGGRSTPKSRPSKG